MCHLGFHWTLIMIISHLRNLFMTQRIIKRETFKTGHLENVMADVNTDGALVKPLSSEGQSCLFDCHFFLCFSTFLLFLAFISSSFHLSNWHCKAFFSFFPFHYMTSFPGCWDISRLVAVNLPSFFRNDINNILPSLSSYKRLRWNHSL